MSVSRKLHWLRIALVLYACVVSCHVDATCSSDRLRYCVLLPLAVWLIINYEHSPACLASEEEARCRVRAFFWGVRQGCSHMQK